MTDTIEVPRELLEKWADKLEGSDSAGYGWEDLLASELPALLAQPASVPDEVRRDAERYRWLRERQFSFSHDEAERGIATRRWGEWHYDTPECHAAQMDKAIDAAMATKEVKQ